MSVGLGDRRAGPRPSIHDGLLYPVLILGVAMFVVPTAVGWLFDAAAPAAGWDLSAVDVQTLRTGASLVGQGAALFGLTIYRVTSRSGLGLPAAALGLPGWMGSVRWPRELLIGLVGGIGITALNILGTIVMKALFSLFMDEDVLAEHIAWESGAVVEALGAGASGWFALLLPLVAVVIAPVSEELFFRGYLYGLLKSRLPHDGDAVYWSAAVFALVHLYLIHLLPVFVIGVALTLLYQWRRSLIAPIVAHATANFIVTVTALITYSSP